METRKKPFDQLIEKTAPFLEGAVSGTAVRWVTWPLEKTIYDASQKDQSATYLKIVRNNFRLNILRELNKNFFKTGLLQTIAKSFSGIGVVNYVNSSYADCTANQKSLYATALGAPLETLLTSRGEYHKVNEFNKVENSHDIKGIRKAMFPPNFSRVMSATFPRVLWSSLITYGGIYKTTELIESLFPTEICTNSTLVKPGAAFIASFAVQPIIMPIINYQTYVLQDPSKPLIATTKQFIKEHTLRELLKGSFARGAHRSLYYGLSLFMSDKIKQYWDSDKLKVEDKQPAWDKKYK